MARLEFSEIDTGQPLRVQDTQRILKIARNTDNPEILTGVLIALSNSKFLRLAKTSLILKLISAAANKDKFATKLFIGRTYTTDEYHEEDIELMKEVGKSIKASPHKYTFRVVCAAADFLAEYDPINLPPISSKEEELGIQINW